MNISRKKTSQLSVAGAFTLLACFIPASVPTGMAELFLPKALAQAESTAGATKNPKAQALFKEALDLSSGGNWMGARNLLDQAISLDANFGKAYANRSAARFNTGDNRGAVEDSEKAVKFFPDNKGLADIHNRALANLNGPPAAAVNPNAEALRRQAIARQILLQSQLGGDMSSPAYMIMQQANMVGAAARAQQVLHPSQPANNAAAAVVVGKDNPFSGHSDSSGPFKNAGTDKSPFSAGSSDNSPFGH